MSTIKQVIRLHMDGMKNREIARVLGIYKGTVNKYVSKAEADTMSKEELLSLDPRPHYHESADRIYGMPYDGFDVRFRVVGDELHVLSIVKISGENQK